MISDENEKREARSIDNDAIALCCVMADIGEVGEAPELTKIAQAVVLHSDPLVCKCNLDNGAILYDVPTDDSPGSCLRHEEIKLCRLHSHLASMFLGSGYVHLVKCMLMGVGMNLPIEAECVVCFIF